MGALYAYTSTDYPFALEQVVVVNEVMANSGASDPDWIELHNRSSAPVDISGWFLSDSASDYAKYRIPNGTVIPAGGYVTYYEDSNFGATSIDPGRITPFAFSENGETAYLHSAVNDELTDSPAANVFQNFIDAPDFYRFTDLAIAQDAGGLWSYPKWPSHLDHILITHQFFAASDRPEALTEVVPLHLLMGQWSLYEKNVSDHLPVVLRIKP